MVMHGRDGVSAGNAHGCPDGSDDKERYVQSIFSQISRYGIHVFKTNRNEKQERSFIPSSNCWHKKYHFWGMGCNYKI